MYFHDKKAYNKMLSTPPKGRMYIARITYAKFNVYIHLFELHIYALP